MSTKQSRTIDQRAKRIIKRMTEAGTYNENDYPKADREIIAEEFADVVETDPRVRELVEALREIARLWPEPPNCASVLSVSGVNDGKQRAILLDAALKIARAAIAKFELK